MIKPTYKSAIEWVAFNDDVEQTDVDVISEQMTVVFISDIFGVDTSKIARDILELRCREYNITPPRYY